MRTYVWGKQRKKAQPSRRSELVAAGKKGGLATLQRYGPEHFSRIGQKGYLAVKRGAGRQMPGRRVWLPGPLVPLIVELLSQAQTSSQLGLAQGVAVRALLMKLGAMQTPLSKKKVLPPSE